MLESFASGQERPKNDQENSTDLDLTRVDVTPDSQSPALNITMIRNMLRINSRACIERRDNFWAVDHSTGGRRYEVDFGSLLPARSNFSDHFAARRKQGRSTHVLDLFGSGVEFAGDKNVQTLTGVRLLNVPVGKENKLKAHNWEVVEGDLFEAETWIKLKSSLDRRAIDKVDLALLRPLGAFRGVPRDASSDPQLLMSFNSLYQDVIAQTYSLLSNDSGRLIFKLPRIDRSTYCGNVEPWSKLARESGMEVRSDPTRGSMLIVKDSNSPQELPLPDPQVFISFK